jgi:hypothetical protein
MAPKDAWDKVYIVLTGCLVGVGIVTLIAVWVQAIETRKSAQEIRKSVDLQKAAFAQWVITDNWEGGGTYPSAAGGYFMTIKFNIVNPTKFRLSLHSLTVSVLDGNGWSIRRADNRPDFLPPDGHYPASIAVRLKDAKRGAHGGLELSRSERIINVSVEYADVLGRRESQAFAMICDIMSEMRIDFRPLSAKPPKPSDQRQNTN